MLGLVVYTGTDTKLVQNFGTYKFKKPKFEQLLNIISAVQALIFFASCTILTIGNHYWNKKYYDHYGYIFGNGPSAS